MASLQLFTETGPAGPVLTSSKGQFSTVWRDSHETPQTPGFNERAHGFRSFSDMLLEAEKRGVPKLEKTEKSGYRVRAVE